ncbi:MAG TPA: FtsX-like permease family protein [Tepidisphaeraceae bacterium]|jgi:lipoprotein-releasing system permease protein|nr:FtsX-like permease family protein [Tepidisphaeraceae bacterium]
MPAIQIILWSIVAFAPIATIFALVRILTGPRIISKLMVRYLMKRRIAWVSLIAVMLCTAMVLIVISVMGGWLRMFRETNHALIGDLIVYRTSLDGFSHYQEMIDQIKKIPEVKEATPTVRSYGLAEIGIGHTQSPIRTPVEVIGLDIKQIGQVNGFVRALHLQPGVLRAKAKEYADQAAQKEREASHTTVVPMADDLRADAEDLAATAKSFQAKADAFPSWVKPLPDEAYLRGGLSSSKNNPAKFGGIVVGCGVIGLRGTDPIEIEYFHAWVKLTLLKFSGDFSDEDLQDKTSTNYYWLSDVSHTGVFQADENEVYLPFDVLQDRLGMGASTYTSASTGQEETEPARCSEILISLNPGVDPYAAKPQISAAVDAVMQKFDLYYPDPGQLRVETWDEKQQDFLSAVEHEKSLLVILFAIISIVAIFLIFCIFFMIVMEKTRDIGIVKSVGATSSSIAAIFLGYGLSIGLLGGGLGLLLAYLVVHNINQLHAWLGVHFHIQIWNAKTYLFDTIPNTMDGHDIAVIVSVAILSSVLGALLPAIRAARMNPVEALRWE